jgi:hypothetical protein
MIDGEKLKLSFPTTNTSRATVGVKSRLFEGYPVLPALPQVVTSVGSITASSPCFACFAQPFVVRFERYSTMETLLLPFDAVIVLLDLRPLTHLAACALALVFGVERIIRKIFFTACAVSHAAKVTPVDRSWEQSTGFP